MIISLLMEPFPLAFLSFSSLIPFEISSFVNGVSRVGSCLLPGRICFLFGTLSMQGLTPTTRHGVLKHAGNMFRKSLKLKNIC